MTNKLEPIYQDLLACGACTHLDITGVDVRPGAGLRLVGRNRSGRDNLAWIDERPITEPAVARDLTKHAIGSDPTQPGQTRNYCTFHFAAKNTRGDFHQRRTPTTVRTGATVATEHGCTHGCRSAGKPVCFGLEAISGLRVRRSVLLQTVNFLVQHQKRTMGTEQQQGHVATCVLCNDNVTTFF
jgi:hypothetical protein